MQHQRYYPGTTTDVVFAAKLSWTANGKLLASTAVPPPTQFQMAQFPMMQQGQRPRTQELTVYSIHKVKFIPARKRCSTGIYYTTGKLEAKKGPCNSSGV
uniref:Uncharacterized protein n=1 Tax=Romanomermis culicivorax TaxID=13658 RepID=A0A915JAY0_ROMCU